MDIVLGDESGLDLSQRIAHAMGDPLVRRGDGSMAYQLAVVADDHASNVSRIVRGRDIASSTATQVALYRLAGWKEPNYRHHLLLLEPRGEKLAKFHGSVSVETLGKIYTAAGLGGILAAVSGLVPCEAHAGSPNPPALGLEEIRAIFDWKHVRTDDRILGFDGSKLVF